MQHIDLFLGRLGRLLALSASLCLVVMMLQICLDVVGRYLFGAPMPSTLEIVSDWWMPALIFLPLLNVEWRNENIAVDLFYQSRGPRTQAVMDAISLVCFGGFLALIAYAGFEQAMRGFRQGEFIVGMIPVITWPPRFFLPVAGGLTVLLCFVRALEALVRAVSAPTLTRDHQGPHRG
ncbi:TRAP transporter small permease subunit [Stappia sp. ES.058]|uniref:TRAP transporter small permease subunit n=1 Tax=Stappia sp. ES.058 TaxID=1881061 RepID=UPI000879F06F|nr:TRAP transporter small permease [Stappia sp. ES.058]SDU45585.1 TRAP-type mannitol/chloroaromatic compound transport system, small permease component [Stappia sp. ES.058]